MNEKNVSDYGWNTSEISVACLRVSKHVAKEISLHGGKRVLDIGCGNGSLCGVLSKLGLYVVGVENDKAGVNIAKATYPDIRFYKASVQDDVAEILTSENEKFDVVVSTEVIEHLYSPEQLLQFARNIIKENGLLILTMPYYGYAKNLAISLLNKWDQHHSALVTCGHIKFFSKKTITKLVNDNNFSAVSCYGVGRPIPLFWNTMLITAKPT